MTKLSIAFGKFQKNTFEIRSLIIKEVDDVTQVHFFVYIRESMVTGIVLASYSFLFDRVMDPLMIFITELLYKIYISEKKSKEEWSDNIVNVIRQSSGFEPWRTFRQSTVSVSGE